MDIRIREIAGKSAGTYFIVDDNSQSPEFLESSKLRLFFINSELGTVNNLVIFKQGDIDGLEKVFGKSNRKKEKQGNFSIKACKKALLTGPIAVINLRTFDSTLDKSGIYGMSPNKTVAESKLISYPALFNTNGFWTVKGKNIGSNLTTDNLLHFGNVGTRDISFFVTVAKRANVDMKTSEGGEKLISSELEIEDYPALINSDLTIADTFVDVYIFDNKFDPANVTTNRYYGHLFNQTGMIDNSKINELMNIPEAGFNRVITGSLIPNLKSERNEEISIDVLINQVFAETGLICHIDDNILENDDIDNLPVINTQNIGYYNTDGTLVSVGNLLSHRLQPLVSTELKNIDLLVLTETDILPLTTEKLVHYSIGPVLGVPTLQNVVPGILENGIRIGDTITDMLGNISTVKSIVITKSNSNDGLPALSKKTYTAVNYNLTDSIDVKAGYYFTRNIVEGSKIVPTNLISYKPRTEQFTDGSANKQSEILDGMLNPGIVKGLKTFGGIRYIVDSFKSFVEGGYKYQFGELANQLDKGNRFVRCIINEPFFEDLENSVNPLFKESPTSTFDFRFLETGGNINYSTNFLTKFTLGAEKCYFFGSVLDGKDEMISAPEISGLFNNKTFEWDVIANATGYLNSVDGIYTNPDDIERKSLEMFKWNPIIKTNKGFTIYGNATAQKKKTSLSQIHNSELLRYIKESLYNLSTDEAFKKGTYNEYLATETEVKTFMEDLALQGAIQPNPIVICNASNNTTDIQKQKIKLIYIEYFNIDSLDKVVFQLNLK